MIIQNRKKKSNTKTVASIIAGLTILIMLVGFINPAAAETIPNDPFFTKTFGEDQPVMWHLLRGNGGIDAIDAWDIPQNKNVVVAVLDSGIFPDHYDLDDSVRKNLKEVQGTIGIDDDKNGYIDDYWGWDVTLNNNIIADQKGHGTECAGFVGSVANNNEGGSGVAWNVSIMPIKIADPLGKSNFSSSLIFLPFE